MLIVPTVEELESEQMFSLCSLGSVTLFASVAQAGPRKCCSLYSGEKKKKGDITLCVTLLSVLDGDKKVF